MGNIKRSITLLLVLGFALSALSQRLVLGSVQDAFLKIPLTEAKVSLLLAADSTVIIDSIPVIPRYREDGTLREAEFKIEPERKTCEYLIRVTLDGYEDGYQLLAIDEKRTEDG